MRISPLKQLHLNDQELKRFARQIYEWSDAFQNVDILNGRHIKNILVTTARVTVEHKLGRVPQGYIITSKDSNGDIWDVSRSATELVLDSSATVTISIWVF